MATDWLETLRKKQQRAQVLRAELAQIEAELRDAKAILSGRLDFDADPPSKPTSRHGFTGGRRARPIQEGSSVWWTKAVLAESGTAMHIDSIIKTINELSPTKVVKATLVSNLSRYITHGDTFTRPAPNTFGLVEWDKQKVTTEQP